MADQPSDQSNLDRSFVAAMKAAEGAPDSGDAWDHLEDLADKLGRPDDVAQLYRDTLEQRLAPDVFRTVAERAVQYHEEWFGDAPERVTQLLGRICELSPSSDWAFERLVMMLTTNGQWDELLSAYDRAISSAVDLDRKKQLLDDAAQASKDFADRPDRAADYLQQLLALDPDNAHLVQSLERLLERGKRHRDLIALWDNRLQHQEADERRQTRLRMAACWLDELGEAPRALEVLRALLEESPGHEEACTLLERILAQDEAELSTRRQAMSLLRKNYLVADRPDEVVRLLARALEFVEAEERRPIHRELGSRLAILGKHEEALNHYRALVLEDPTDADARKQMRQLADRTSRHDLHAQALVDAAGASSDQPTRAAVLLDAARIKRRALEDAEGAIAIYRSVLGAESNEASHALAAAHALDELLAAAGRDAERLDVLETLASLEGTQSGRRAVMAEAARLADQLGEADRALANWTPVLEADARDLEALNAVVDLLSRNRRWAELVSALERRADAVQLPLQRRADWVRIAEIQQRELDAKAAAIDTWLRVRQTFGDAPDVIEALDVLMSSEDRQEELAHILSEGASAARHRNVSLLRRLGELYREQLDQPEQAVTWYAAALAMAPADEVSREGMRALLGVKGATRDAAAALAAAYRATDDDESLLGLLDHRVGAARDRGEQASLLRDAAKLYLDRHKDAAAALGCLCRALPLEPDNLATESLMMRLAEHTGRWATVAESLRMAGDAAVTTPARAAQLRVAEGSVRRRLDDIEAALEAYRAAAELSPDDAATLDTLARCAAEAAQWESAAHATVRTTAVRDRAVPDLLAYLDAQAEARDAYAVLSTALEAALDESPLPTHLAPALYEQAARWQRDRVGDPAAAERLASRAAELAPSESNLTLLAELRRQLEAADLRGALLELDRLQPRALDALQEAARITLHPPADGTPTSTDRHAVVERLYRKAASMWNRNESTTGTLEPASVAQWALDRLVELHIEEGRPTRAVDALMDGTRLPLEPERALHLRRRAAEMLAEHGQRGRAIDVYRSVLEAQPDDVDVLQRVAQLCEQEGRISEALTLRLKEIALVDEEERRLELRLEHARLTGALEAKGGRVASLLANLDDHPGHRPSVEQLRQVLTERGKYDQLADILGQQASVLESRGDAALAAALWIDAARIAETSLNDIPRAIDAFARVVQLHPDTDALDALARLHLGGGQPAEAARCLERRLELTPDSDRVAVLLRLARARRKAEERDGAIQALRDAFAEAPRNAEVRKLLFALYRQSHDWEALADALSRAALELSDERTVLAYAEEASQIYRERLESPARAVPVLRRAVDVSPDDRQLRLALAQGLAADGALDEARAMFDALIADFGRRRSPERARIHLELAHVLRAQEETDAALEQLDTASKMAPGDLEILMNLAELASDTEQLAQAERAYRSLLLTVRRGDPKDLPIGPAEVLFQLADLAARGDQADKASELIESGLEALTQHDREATRIQNKLRARGDLTLLERVLRHRLEHVEVAHRRAAIMSELGALLEEHLERPDEGLEMRLAAVHADPSSPPQHQAARDAAGRMGRLDAYVSQVEALLADERADRSPHVRCELLLRLGEVLEKERQDLDRASTLYGQAEATGVRTVDVWRAQARIAGARGDSGEQMRLLAQLANLGEAESETRTDALYRLGEVQLAAEETLEEGLATLRKALTDEFRGERAAMILRQTAERIGAHAGVLETYELVARRCGDDDVLLDFLTRRLDHEGATIDHAREATEIASRLERMDEAEAIMLRAAEMGRAGSREGDLAAVDWALLGLAERRMNAGDLPGAVRWLIEAAEVAELSSVFALADRVLELARRPEGDLTLAAKLYERLLERAPTAREAWRPLAELYGELGDVERLERIVEETLDGLEEAADKNGLRVALAHALLSHESRRDDAVEILRGVIEEDPQHAEARRLLMDHLETTGQREAVHELLRNQLALARNEGDHGVLKTLSLELARRLDREHPDDALAVLRDALQGMPEDADLLRALLQRLDDEDHSERAQLLEALLREVEPEEVAEHALALVNLYDRLEDPSGAMRTLESAVGRAPEHESLRQALQTRYQAAGQVEGEVRVLLISAMQQSDDLQRVPYWRSAAKLRRERLEDPHGAADLLERAVTTRPEDFGLRTELAGALSAAGQHRRAVEAISEVMGEPTEQTLPLWLTRAQLKQASGDEDGAIADLEEAFAVSGAMAAPLLANALEQRMASAAEANHHDAERYATLRYVEVQLQARAQEQATACLASWTARHTDDIEALRRLRELGTDAGEWKRVADTCERLIHLEEGTAQLDAALGLSHAYQELGEPEGARAGLEHVAQAQPQSAEIRRALRRIYERQGDERALASLLVEDARAVDGPRKRAELLGQAGQLLVDLGEAAQAVPALQEALQLVPGDPTATVALADAYLLDGRLDEAAELIDVAIEAGKGRRSAEMSRLFHRKAQLAAAQGELKQQLELLSEAHLCNKKNGEVAAALADLAEEMGDWDLAARTLRTITLIDDDACPISRGEAYLRQGRIAKRQGDDKTARMWARRAKREAPDDEEVDSFLEELGERPSIMPRR